MTGILCCFIFKFCIHYLRIISDIEIKIFDINKVTVDDFSVKIGFTKKLWEKWLESEDSKKMSFKQHFIENLEE